MVRPVKQNIYKRREQCDRMLVASDKGVTHVRNYPYKDGITGTFNGPREEIW